MRILEGAAKQLKKAWKWDQEYPRSYPSNTEHLLWQTIADLQGKRLVRSAPLKLSLPPTPRTFAELVPEKMIRYAYEDQNQGSYKAALRRAAEGDYRWARKIFRAVETAFTIDQHGLELAPPPRVHFLHRNLLEIAKVAGFSSATNEGIAEFFEDVCPCGQKHSTEAVRKFRERQKTKGKKRQPLSI